MKKIKIAPLLFFTKQSALEKINFARNWNVLTDDQVKTRYILNYVLWNNLNDKLE